MSENEYANGNRKVIVEHLESSMTAETNALTL